MFCTGCGMELSEQAVFCTNCGVRVKRGNQPLQEPQRQQHRQQQQKPPQENMENDFVDRGEFLALHAGRTTKAMALASRIVLLVSMLVLIGGAIFGLGQDLREIPIISMLELDNMLDDAFAELDELDEDEIDEDVDNMVQRMKEYADYDEEGIEKYGKWMKRFGRNPSLWNLSNVMIAAGEAGNMGGGMKAMIGVYLILPAIMLLAYILAALFALVGGLTKNTGWTGASVIISLFALVLGSGTAFAVAGTALLIAQMVLCELINNRYLKYLFLAKEG